MWSPYGTDSIGVRLLINNGLVWDAASHGKSLGRLSEKKIYLFVLSWLRDRPDLSTRSFVCGIDSN